MLGDSQPLSSQDSAAFGTSIMGTLGRIRDAIALYTGFGSQSPPSSPTVHPETLDSDDLVPTLAAATSSSAHASSSSQPDQFSESRARHAAEILAVHGIKVRDFAYESKLPPVPAYRPRIARQGSNPRKLKRSRKTYEDEEFYFPVILPRVSGPNPHAVAPPAPSSSTTQDGRHASEDKRPLKRAKPLQRELTEPIILSQSQPPSQNPEFGDIREILPTLRVEPRPAFHVLWNLEADLFGGPSLPAGPRTPVMEPQDFEMDSPSSSQQRRATREEMAVDVDMDWIETPIITPQGSEILGSGCGSRLSTCSSLTSLAESASGESTSSGFVPARLSIERSLPDVTQICTRATVHRTSSSPVASHTRHRQHNSSSPSSSHTRRHTSTQHAPHLQMPYQLRSRANDCSRHSPSPAAVRKARRSQRMASPALVPQRRKAGKTRSTLSKQVSGMDVSLKQGPRRSARTKTQLASTVVATAKPTSASRRK